MLSGIPLPNAPAGNFQEGFKNANELSRQLLENRMKNLQNQYYGPNIESEMALRGAQTNELNTMTPLKAAELGLKNQFYPSDIKSQMAFRGAQTNKLNTMTPLEAAELRTRNEFLPQTLQSDITYKNAMADWRKSGGMGGMGVDQKAAQGFNNQLRMDHPDWTPEQINDASNAYYEGRNTLSDGTPLPPLSGQAEDRLTKITNKNAPVAVRNQAANYDVLYTDLKDFDIEAVKSFAGPQGKVRLAQAKAKMLVNPDDPSIDPMARRFISAMNQAIYNMDSMRKAFGTSVVPEYVYKTIGRLTNPTDSIFNDPSQVEKNYKAVVDQVKKNRDLYFQKSKKGVTAGVENENENEKIQEWGRDANGKAIRIS